MTRAPSGSTCTVRFSETQAKETTANDAVAGYRTYHNHSFTKQRETLINNAADIIYQWTEIIIIGLCEFICKYACISTYIPKTLSFAQKKDEFASVLFANFSNEK